MRLQEIIQQDLTALSHVSGAPTKELLKVVMAEFSRYPKKEIPDDEAIRIVRKMCANAIECGNPHEVVILDKYLPKMMDEIALQHYLEIVILVYDQPTMADIMRHIKQSGRTDIDMRMASKIANELLTK